MDRLDPSDALHLWIPKVIKQAFSFEKGTLVCMPLNLPRAANIAYSPALSERVKNKHYQWSLLRLIQAAVAWGEFLAESPRPPCDAGRRGALSCRWSFDVPWCDLPPQPRHTGGLKPQAVSRCGGHTSCDMAPAAQGCGQPLCALCLASCSGCLTEKTAFFWNTMEIFVGKRSIFNQT